MLSHIRRCGVVNQTPRWQRDLVCRKLDRGGRRESSWPAKVHLATADYSFYWVHGDADLHFRWYCDRQMRLLLFNLISYGTVLRVATSTELCISHACKKGTCCHLSLVSSQDLPDIFVVGFDCRTTSPPDNIARLMTNSRVHLRQCSLTKIQTEKPKTGCW